MSRQRSARTELVKEKIRTRLREGVYRPGDRFLSAREVAATFEVSYQTAHRLVQELSEEGWLDRRAASGTFIPGGRVEMLGAQLFWSARARRAGSFGARLLSDLCARFKRDRIPYKIAWADAARPVAPASKYVPVVWERPEIVQNCVHNKRAALLLNDRPQPGMAAAWLDSVSIDDFSGGVCAAQLLWKESRRHARFAVLAGPTNDARSNARRDGFLSLAKSAVVVSARSWFFEDGYDVAAPVIQSGRDGIFCCNDRLAQAVLKWSEDHDVLCPRLVGFDDAPIAEELNLTTIAIPWDEMIAGAADILKRRLNGDTGAARQLIVTPRPVVRRL
ncbi:MAG: hypothetical protein JWN98_1069 [Abditibacteriota bacterium]|nr:hypothetical protein [Abditibacteriota bacterium]